MSLDEDRDDRRASLLITLVVFAAFAIFLWLRGCTDEKGARRTLEAMGFTHIEITGWSTICGRDDVHCTGFRAIGPGGSPLTGAVGCGCFAKGCTVRLGR